MTALLFIIIIIVLSRFDTDFLLIRVVPDSSLAGITGLVLTVAGLGFSGWARYHLGRFWSSMVEVKVGHQLIRTGPYRVVRNPMYTGILIAFTGVVVAIGVLFAFIALVIGIVSILVKIKAEEEILTEKFGGEYLEYKQEVKAIIPFII